MAYPVLDEALPLDQTSDNFRFSAAVAEFGMLLRNSAFKGDATYEQVRELARSAMGEDETGYRLEFLQLVETAELLGG
jgi:Ca-activated chloride channel family protein